MYSEQLSIKHGMHMGCFAMLQSTSREYGKTITQDMVNKMPDKDTRDLPVCRTCRIAQGRECRKVLDA